MGLDANISRSEICTSLRKHHAFNDLILEASDRIFGPLPYGVPIPICDALLDLIEDGLSKDGAQPTMTIPEGFFDDEPAASSATDAIYLAFVVKLRERLDESGYLFYDFSC